MAGELMCAASLVLLMHPMRLVAAALSAVAVVNRIHSIPER